MVTTNDDDIIIISSDSEDSDSALRPRKKQAVILRSKACSWVLSDGCIIWQRCNKQSETKKNGRSKPEESDLDSEDDYIPEDSDAATNDMLSSPEKTKQLGECLPPGPTFQDRANNDAFV